MTGLVADWGILAGGTSPLDSLGVSKESESLQKEIVQSQKSILRNNELARKSIVLEVLQEFLLTGQEPFPNILVQRLHYLEDVSEEEYPEQGLMSESSLRFFLHFAQWLTSTYLDANLPDIVLTPDGNILAIWNPEKNRYFSLSFQNDGNVCFVAFFPNSRRSSRINRMTGVSTVDDILTAVNFPRLLGWIQPAA